VGAVSAQQNVFISPYSVGTALALAMEGAQGETAQELKMAVGYGPEEDQDAIHHDLRSLLAALGSTEGVELALANALWLSTTFPIHDQYVERARQLQSEVSNVDFAQSESARSTINGWVEKQTKNKVKDLLPHGALDSRVALVITNAIYFKGAWANAFNKANTQEEDFHLLGGSGTVKAKMMKQTKLKARYSRFSDHAMLQLPYKGNNVVMLVMLPHENSPSALEALVSAESLKNISNNRLSLGQAEVNVTLPQFKFDFELELSSLLYDMGIKVPFDRKAADFSPMAADGSNSLFISKVYHKAFVEVNEEGTEAAAATAVKLMMRCAVVMPSPVVDFVVDRPFVFALYSGALECPLFVGKVVNPSS
jgi:serpin B